MRIEKLVQEHNVKIQWIHFPLHPDTPQEGKTLEELFAGRGMDIEQMKVQMKERMAAEGLPYGERTSTYNSRLAQELAVWAETQDGGDAIHDALFRAYFVDAKNIGDVDVLVAVAESIGLSGAEARNVVENRTHQPMVDEHWEKSRQYGVTGVPTFVSNMKGVVGAQPYEALVSLVEAARTET